MFSVPHGGNVKLADAPERAKGTKVQDDRVNELAAAIQRQLLAKSGRQAYLVGAKISRKYIDFNRKAEDAYEAPAAAPIYDAYYGAQCLLDGFSVPWPGTQCGNDFDDFGHINFLQLAVA